MRKILLLTILLSIVFAQEKVIIELDGPMEGQKESGIMIDGKKHGQWIIYDETGISLIQNFRDGEKDGYEITFYSEEKGNLNPPKNTNHVGLIYKVVHYKKGKVMNQVFYVGEEKVDSIDLHDENGEYLKSILINNEDLTVEISE